MNAIDRPEPALPPNPGSLEAIQAAQAIVRRAGKDKDLSAAAFLAQRRAFSNGDISAIFETLRLNVVDADEQLAIDAGVLVPSTKPAGLSRGDRFCLALARRLGVPALTADRAWKRMEVATGVQVELIR